MTIENRQELERLAQVLGLDVEEILRDPYKAVRPAMDYLDERDSLYNKPKYRAAAEVSKLLIKITPIPDVGSKTV